MRYFATLLALISISAVAFAQGGPCKDQWKSKREAHEALHQCLQAWAQDVNPEAANPSDKCDSKLSDFTNASAALHDCRKQNAKK